MAPSTLQQSNVASWKIHHLLRWFYQLETSIHGEFLIATITILSYHGLFVWGSELLQRFFQKLQGFWQRTCGIRWSFVKALLGLASRPLKLSFVWKHTQKILQSPMLLSVPFKIAMNFWGRPSPSLFFTRKKCAPEDSGAGKGWDLQMHGTHPHGKMRSSGAQRQLKLSLLKSQMDGSWNGWLWYLKI